jgi:hypothetical protein
MEQLLRCAKPIEKITSHISYLEDKLKKYETKKSPNQSYITLKSHLPSPSYSDPFDSRPLGEISADSRFLKALIDTYYAHIDPKEHLVPKNRIQFHLTNANHLIYVVLALSSFHMPNDFGYNLNEARKYFFTLAQSQLPQAYANPSADAIRGLLLMAIHETRQSHSFKAAHYFDVMIRMCQQLDLTNNIKRISDAKDSQSDEGLLLNILPIIKLGSQYSAVLSGIPSVIKNLSNTIEPFESLVSLHQGGESFNVYKNCTHDPNSCHCYLSAIFDYSFKACVKLVQWLKPYSDSPQLEFNKAYERFCTDIQFDFEEKEVRMPPKFDNELIHKYLSKNLSHDERIQFHSFTTYHMASLLTRWPSAANFPLPVNFAPSTFLAISTSADELYAIMEEWDRISNQYPKDDSISFLPIPSGVTVLLCVVYLNNWHSVQHISPSVATTYLNKIEYIATLINQMSPETSGGGILMRRLLSALKNFEVPSSFIEKIQEL